VSPPTELLWALIGLILTIGGTFLEAFTTNFPWNWSQDGVQTYSLQVNFQVGAVLLVGCLGGKRAATLSQIVYLILGLTRFPVFTQGGGLDYIYQPSFGYLLGFIPGAWVCGSFAFRLPSRLESLAFSCLCGLFTIHATGLGYLIATYALRWVDINALSFPEAVLNFSIYPIPGQLAVVCAVTVLAFALRHLMFY
jgi:biotin transport system substrate-specific component